MNQSNQRSVTMPNQSDPMVRIALLEERVAELEQRLVRLENSAGVQLPGSFAAPPVAPPLEADPAFEIVKIDARITESNDAWSRFAWKLIMKNLSGNPLTFHASIEFLDQDGFVVADAFQPNLLLRPDGEQPFTGYELVMDSIVGTIKVVQAKIGLA